jgi:hypothetical protein
MEPSTTETIRTSVEKKIDSFVEGNLEHALETISALWEVANKDGDAKEPLTIVPAVSASRFVFCV